MTHVKILAAATVAASVVAISPSLAQQHSHAMGAAPTAAPSAGVAAGANVNAGANVTAGANMHTAQMNPAAPTGSGNWNGNWSGRDWRWRDRRFHGGPGFTFGFGAGPAYYDDYAYAGYPYDGYAYYGDPYYSDTFAYDPGPVVETAPAVGVAVSGGADPAYCARRYRSYDPASGTFLGYDGIRHSCP